MRVKGGDGGRGGSYSGRGVVVKYGVRGGDGEWSERKRC